MSRNPYHLPDQPPTLRQSVFALMDILGYTGMTKQSERAGTQGELLQRLYRALSEGRKGLEDWPPPKLGNRDRYALKAFTDNIVVGWPVHHDVESEFERAFFKLANFQLSMVIEGFFLRGALSVGDAYVDEIAVFGNALIEAHDGEATLARDPRIILTSSAVEVIKKHLTYYTEPASAPHVRCVLRDADGQWFLNYLDSVLMVEEAGPFYRDLLRHKEVVEENLHKHRGDPVVWSKYAWVAGYHNFFCDLHPRYFTDEHKINVDLFRPWPSRIVD